MKILLYAHGGSKNHGCEAIVRSTRLLLGDNNQITLLSYVPDEDKYYKLDDIVNICGEVNSINKKTFEFLVSYFEQKLFKNYHHMDALQHKDAINKLDNDYDYAFFIGGDNYCYSDVKNYSYINKYIRKKAKRTVLWGCSVEPEILNDKCIRNDIQKFSLIVARESISYDALSKINKNTHLLPDPAFFLPIEKIDLPLQMTNSETIGINISPLIFKYGNEDLILQSFLNLIKYILNNSSDNIALIPHVVWDHNDDYNVIKRLYEMIGNDDRVMIIGDHNCMQQKYIISHCKRFIGARTHSTIAAYSTGVPTLVVGYSVKARGIAKDLFGSIDNYVIPVQQITNSNQLTEKYKWIAENDELIRNTLKEKKNDYERLELEYAKLL